MTDYAIDQVAELMNVTRHTLRYYEREGLLEPVAKAANGHRRYSEDDLRWVEFLTLLRGTGMPIREMKSFVALTRAGDHTIAERVAVLSLYRDTLKARMAADVERLAFLDRKLDYYGGVLSAQRPAPAHISAEISMA